MVKKQNTSAADSGAAPHKVNEAIEEESDDEDSFEETAPVKKSKTSIAAPAAAAEEKTKPSADSFLEEFQQAQSRNQKR